MAEQYSIVYVYTHLLDPSSAAGRFGCLHILATVTTAAVNIRVHIYFLVSVFMHTCMLSVHILYINTQKWHRWILW